MSELSVCLGEKKNQVLEPLDSPATLRPLGNQTFSATS